MYVLACFTCAIVRLLQLPTLSQHFHLAHLYGQNRTPINSIPGSPPRETNAQTFEYPAHGAISSPSYDAQGLQRQSSPSGDEAAPRQETTSPHESFACPFAKHDPDLHPDCLKKVLRRIADVRTHIQRFHKQPVHCPRCGVTFTGKQKDRDRQSHIRQQTCSNRQVGKLGVTMAEEKEIAKRGGESARATGGTIYERRWYYFWEVIFPDETLPESPYARPAFQEQTDLAIRSFFDRGHVKNLISQCRPDLQDELFLFTEKLLENYLKHTGRLNGTNPGSYSSSQAVQVSRFGPSQAEPVPTPFEATQPEVFDGSQTQDNALNFDPNPFIDPYFYSDDYGTNYFHSGG